ncbi:hypothetical protein KEM55_004620, partial [Ascosphaera atra]
AFANPNPQIPDYASQQFHHHPFQPLKYNVDPYAADRFFPAYAPHPTTSARAPLPPMQVQSIGAPPVLPPIRSQPQACSSIPPLVSLADLKYDQFARQQQQQREEQQRQQQQQAQQQRQQQQQQQYAQQQAQEKKSTGGVSAHLDYDTDQMADFVAEMTHGMHLLYRTRFNIGDIDLIRSIPTEATNVQTPPEFRKYVYQILTATRLPSATILLALYYLSARLRFLAQNDIYATDSNGNIDQTEVYKMLTTALLLGSKFLDDNTFQNRSWSDVSAISTAELNRMEIEWLFDFDWCIHSRVYDEVDGFPVWKRQWDTWSIRYHEKKRVALVAKAQAEVTAQQQRQEQQQQQQQQQQQRLEWMLRQQREAQRRAAHAAHAASLRERAINPMHSLEGAIRQAQAQAQAQAEAQAQAVRDAQRHSRRTSSTAPATAMPSPDGPIPPQYQRS